LIWRAISARDHADRCDAPLAGRLPAANARVDAPQVSGQPGDLAGLRGEGEAAVRADVGPGRLL